MVAMAVEVWGEVVVALGDGLHHVRIRRELDVVYPANFFGDDYLELRTITLSGPATLPKYRFYSFCWLAELIVKVKDDAEDLDVLCGALRFSTPEAKDALLQEEAFASLPTLFVEHLRARLDAHEC